MDKLDDLHTIEKFVFACEKELQQVFTKRSNKVYLKLKHILSIFNEEKLSTSHFQQSTGVGYDDISREKIDRIFAKLFFADKAAVRMQFVSGTHAISSVLFGILRPGDTLISLTGSPYDTLEEVIGLRGAEEGSLNEFGIKYQQIDFVDDKSFFLKTKDLIINTNCKLVFIQKSCGYSWRKSLTNIDIKKICTFVHSIRPDCICFVDNCYGELVEDTEPISNGANIIAGSLIKNLGGTIVPTGGYVVGESNLVEMACCRLTSPGIGSQGGINFGLGRLILQGLFLSPQMICESLNCSDLMALVFSKLGFDVLPEAGSYRSDTIQAIQLKDPLLMQIVCQSFQNNSPVDSFLNVLPSPMNGYDSTLIMSGGTFVEGSTSEFSADAPMRDPYNLFVQGGTHISHAKIALIQLIFKLLEENLITRKFLI
tara:strand:- start:1435 stop:2712 length:1278 start_codon:yes stop_codon:yes gene_type:complete